MHVYPGLIRTLETIGAMDGGGGLPHAEPPWMGSRRVSKVLISLG